MANPIIPVFDGHNDLPWESRDNRHYSVEGIDQELPQTLHTDIPKLRRGGYLAQYWSAYVHSDYAGGDAVIATLEQIDFVHRMCARYPETFKLATTADDVRAAQDEGRIASLIGIEGGHQIANNMAVLREYARLGVRYMTLTWNNTNEFADAAVGEHKWARPERPWPRDRGRDEPHRHDRRPVPRLRRHDARRARRIEAAGHVQPLLVLLRQPASAQRARGRAAHARRQRRRADDHRSARIRVRRRARVGRRRRAGPAPRSQRQGCGRPRRGGPAT